VRPISFFFFFCFFLNLLFDYDSVPTPSQMATDKSTAMNSHEREWKQRPRATGAPKFHFIYFLTYFLTTTDYRHCSKQPRTSQWPQTATNGHKRGWERGWERGPRAAGESNFPFFVLFIFNLLFDYDRLPTLSQPATNGNGNGDHGQQVGPSFFFFPFIYFLTYFLTTTDYRHCSKWPWTSQRPRTGTNGNGNGDHGQQVSPTFLFLVLTF
jgi:hypothetical protein